MGTTVNISSMDNDSTRFAYELLLAGETSRSLYCESSVYTDTYRIEKSSGKVFKNGSKIADTCEYTVL